MGHKRKLFIYKNERRYYWLGWFWYWRTDKVFGFVYTKSDINSGSMPGSDIVTAYVDNNGNGYISDRYALGSKYHRKCA